MRASARVPFQAEQLEVALDVTAQPRNLGLVIHGRALADELNQAQRRPRWKGVDLWRFQSEGGALVGILDVDFSQGLFEQLQQRRELIRRAVLIEFHAQLVVRGLEVAVSDEEGWFELRLTRRD